MARYDGFFPEQALIDSYGGGGFRFAGMSHKGSLLLLPDGVHKWDHAGETRLNEDAISRVLAQSDRIETLLFGSGNDLVPVPEAVRARFREAGVVVEPMSTGAAARTYNILLAEGRLVAAALIVVE